MSSWRVIIYFPIRAASEKNVFPIKACKQHFTCNKTLKISFVFIYITWSRIWRFHSNSLNSEPDSKDTSPSSCQRPWGHQGCRCQQEEAPVGRLNQTPATQTRFSSVSQFSGIANLHSLYLRLIKLYQFLSSCRRQPDNLHIWWCRVVAGFRFSDWLNAPN